MRLFIALLLIPISYAAYGASDAHKAIFLKGNSCAGKTSICNALQERRWQVFDEDSFLSEQLVVHVQSRFPREFELIAQAVSRKNMPHAIVRSQLLFEHAASSIERQRAIKALDSVQMQLNQATEENTQIRKEWIKFLQTAIIATIEQRAMEGNIVIDSWFLNAEDMQALQQRLSAKTVLIYAPLPDLIQRAIKRNSQALIEGTCINSMRFFRQTFSEFFKQYTLSRDESTAIDTLSKADFLHACNIINLCLQSSVDATQTQQLFTRSEFSRESFAALWQPILEQFEDYDTLYVTLKKPYDHIINTNSMLPDWAADYIEKITE